MLLGNLVKIICLYLVGFILIRFLKKKPTDVAVDLLYKGIELLGDINFSFSERNKKREATIKGSTFRKWPLYKFTEKILYDVGLGKLSVEAYINVLALIVLGINIAIFTFTKSVFLFVILFIALYTLLYVAVFMISIQYSNAATLALLDTKDIIISSIKDGFTNSVRINIEALPIQTKKHFKLYLSDIDNKIAPSDALYRLRQRLGPEFEDMYVLCLDYEFNSYKGGESEFQDIVQENTNLRMGIIELQEDMMKTNQDYAACIAAIFITAIAVLGGPAQLVNMCVNSFFGQLIASSNILAIIAGFTYIQMSGYGLKARE